MKHAKISMASSIHLMQGIVDDPTQAWPQSTAHGQTDDPQHADYAAQSHWNGEAYQEVYPADPAYSYPSEQGSQPVADHQQGYMPYAQVGL